MTPAGEAEAAGELLTDGWLSAVSSALADLPTAGIGRLVVQTVVNGSPSGLAAFWTAVEHGGPVVLTSGRHSRPDVSLTWPYSDFEAHWYGELSLEVAYMRGQVKVEGDHALVFDALRPIRSAARRLPALTALRTRP